MKRILFLLFLFALSINVILAQVATINIETPNSNGLSNNQVNSFDVNSDGTILNNSATGGTAQLGNTGVAANNNITGSEADLILFQVTGSSGSGLNGAIEVFGGEAGLIIANPNGISCNGCGFINTSKVDLVTGTANFSGDDLTGFSIDGSSTLNVSGSGFVNDALADELNLVSRNINTVAQAKANTTLRFLAGNDTYDHTTNIITSNATETSGPHSIWISGDLEANYIELISTEISSGGIYGIVNHGEDISADRLKIDSNGLFRNQNDGTNVGSINISGLLEVINAERFINNANITAEILSITTDEFFNNDNGSTQLGNIVVTDTFSLSTPNASYTNTGTVASDSLSLTIGGDFDYVADYLNNGTITTNALNLNVGGDFSYDDSANDFDWGANDTLTVSGSAFFNVYEFYNRGQIDVADNFNATTGKSFFNSGGNISADNFNVTAGNVFLNDFATIDVDNFNVTAMTNFINWGGATINADTFNVTARDFHNTVASEGDGTITADTFTLSVEGDFDYASDFLGNGNIDATHQNFTIRNGDFTNNTSIVLTGDFGVTANDFINASGDITVDTFTLSVEGDFDYASDFLGNGNIEANNQYFTIRNGDFTNNTSIVLAGDFGVTADRFNHQYGSSINVYNFSVTAGTTIINSPVNADNFSVTAGGFFHDSGIINANDFNVTAAGRFENYQAIYADNFNVTTGSGFYNYSNVISNIISISAEDFVNVQTDGTEGYIYANTLTISVEGDFDYEDDYLDNGNIGDTNALNLNVGGDFSYDDSANDFDWGANDTLTVSGSASFNVDDFRNYGKIDVAVDFSVIAADDLRNYGEIDVADDFSVTVADDFYNHGKIDVADDFNVTARYFYNRKSATISAGSFNDTITLFSNNGVMAIGDSRDFGGVTKGNVNDSTITPDGTTLTNAIQSSGIDIINIAQPDSNGLSNNSYSVFSISSSGVVFNNSSSTVSSSLAGTIAGNPNYSASDSASLILNQLTSGYGIYLGGILEVAGDSAAIIIANPNGIFCDACSFVNTDKVDLITGTANFDTAGVISDYTTTANDVWIYNANIVVNDFNVVAGDDFINTDGNISAGSFNVTAARDFYNNSATISADSFNVTAGTDFFNYVNATINANDFTVTAAGDFENDAAINADTVTIDVTNFVNDIDNTGTVSSDSLNFILTDSFTHSSTSFSGFTNFNNLGIITDGGFYNVADLTVNNFNVTAGYDFYNHGEIDVGENLNVTAGASFQNRDSGTINANSFNFTTGTYFSNQSNSTISADNFNVTTGSYFENSNSTINADNFNVVADSFGNYSATINTNSFSVTAGKNFYYSGDLDFELAANDSLTVLGDAFVVVNNFNNHGNVVTDSLTITVDNFATNIDNTGTISADSLNLILTDDFTHSSTSFNGFTFNNLGINTGGNFTNRDALNLSGALTITVENFAANIDNTATISSDSLNLILTESFVHKSVSFNGFTFNNLGINTGGNFTNRHALNLSGALTITVENFAANIDNTATISSDSLNLITSSNFTLLSNTFDDFTFNNLAITANNYTQGASIDIAGDLSIQVSGEASLDDNASIKAKNLFFSAYDFYNQADITITDSATFDIGNNFWNGFYLNGYQDGGDISADSFTVTADNFFNYSNATISADNFNVAAGSFYNGNDSTINANDFNVTAGDDFFNSSSSTINANDFNVTLTGNYSDFHNQDSATINANDFNVTAGDDFYNRYSATINANEFNVTAGDVFYNQESATINAGTVTIEVENFDANIDNTATISSDSLNLILTESFVHQSVSFNGFTFNNLGIITDGGFYNVADLTVNNFNVTAGYDFSNQSNSTITANDFNVTAGTDFLNRYGATISADSFNVTATYFANQSSSTIDADTVTIEVTNFATNIENTATISSDNLNFILTAAFTHESDSFNGFTFNSLGIITDGSFRNEADLTLNNLNVTAGGDGFLNSATINSDSFNVTVLTGYHSDFSSYGTINANDFNVTTERYFYNDGTISADNFNVTAGANFNNHNATINADNFNVTARHSFSNRYEATISANNFNVTVEEEFTNSNNATIDAGSFNVTVTNTNTYGGFYNQDGVIINADNFNVTAADNFYNTDDATISADNFNVTAKGDFYYYGDGDFELATNDSLTVLGDAFIDVNNFNNHSNVVTDSLTITVDNFATNIDNTGTISADSLNLILTDDFTHSSTSFNGFTFNNLGINTGGNFTNRDALNLSGALTITVENFDANIDNTATISSDSLNLILTESFVHQSVSFNGFTFNNLGINTGGNFTNRHALNVPGALTITVENFDANIDNTATISSDSLNLILTDDFTHESDSFTGFNNFSNLGINTGGNFTNSHALNLSGTLTITVADFDVNIDNTATISSDALNLITSSNFTLLSNTFDDFTFNSLAITANNYTQGVAIDIAGDLSIQVNNVARLDDNASIKARNLFFSAFNFYNQADLTITDSATFEIGLDFNNGFYLNRTQYDGGNITADSFNVTAERFFYNQESATINANDFNVTAGDEFINQYSATINANNFNVTAGDEFINQYSATINANNFNVTADYFYNRDAIISADNFNVTTGGDFVNRDGATINADNFNVTAERDFYNSFDGTINVDNFNVTAGDWFSNSFDGTINVDNFNVTAGGMFFNREGSIINADTVIIEVTNFATNIDNTGTISSDSLNFILTDSFTRSSTSFSGFTNFNNLSIITNGSFTNEADLTLNNLNVTAGNIFQNLNSATINSDTFALSVGGDFDYVADYLTNGTITTNAFNLNVGGDFSNNDASNDFVWNASDSLVVLGSADITTDSFNNSGNINADSFNVTATDFTNSGTISANTTLNTTVSSTESDSFNNTGGVLIADTFSLSVAGDFDYVADYLNNGTITTNAFNLNVGGDFSNNDSANDFTWGANDTLTVLGSASVVADSFNNSGNITVNSFDITATDFTNSGTISTNTTLNTTVSSTASNSFNNTGGVVSADIFNLNVAGAFDYTKKGTITTNALNLTVGGDFSYDDSANDFTWGANDILAVSGSANITADSFNNSGTIAVSNSSFDITATDFTNSGTISANTTLNTTVSSTANNSFTNTGGVLSADTVSLSVAGDFDYVAEYLNNGTITTNTLNLNVGGDFSNNDAANDFTWNASDSLTVLGTASITADNFTNFGYIDIANSFNVTAGYRFYNERGAIINANDFNVTAVDRFYNWYGNATINADNFNVSAGKRFYSWTSTINANSFNLTVEEFYNEKNATLNATNNFNVTADNFTNTDGNINADIFSLSVAGDFDYVAEYLGNGTITTNTLNLNVVGDFSNNDAANDFTWGANDTLTVLGTASVVADSFSNSGTIAVSNSSFDITAASLNNSGTISANTTLNTTLTSTTSNSFTNTGGVLNATAFALSVAGDFDYVAEYLGNGTITTNTINLNVGGNFSNNDANNDFTWGANDTLTVLGSASVVADSFNNSGNINVANSSFDITAASLNNSGTISANSFNATVDSFINEASATITAAECNIVYTTYTDSGTITCLDSVAGDTTIIDIARPDANGLSNNSYETFHIPSNGIVLNNSDSAGTSQLAGSISANTNYNSGDAASLILAQVTGNDISLLFGALEVFGAEAGVIIANPSGITCNACSFINASRVDLVTGSNYNVATDTFDSIANTNIALIDDGFDASSVGILNIQAGSFTNTGGLEANTFNLNVVGNFDYTNRGTITTNALNLNVGGDFSNNDANNDFVWGANDTLTVLGTASVVAASFNNSGTIAVSNSSFDITATDFTNAGTISANTTLNTTLASTANNSFNNTGGVISADTVSLSVAGDFDDTKKGIINANYFNLTAGGSFINDDTNNDFVLAENDSLSISGDFTIATNNYIQSGMVDVDGALDISTMGDFTNNTGGDISADTLAITVGGIIDNDGTITTTSLTIDTDTIHNSGDITATTSLNINATNDVFSGGSITTNALDIEAGRNFANGGTISTDSFEITAGYTVINKGSIASDSLDLTTDDFFRNLTGGDISVASLNITAGGKVTNTATIDVSGILSITANNDSARDDDPAGAFFYVSNRGNITATDLNIAAVDNFYNRGNITTTSSFTTSAKNVFLLNEEIDSFVGTYDGGNISLSGDSSFTADSRIENYGNIDLGSNILDISADSFTNHAGATIDAATLNLDVNSLIQNGFINAVINHQ